jgi:asparagine synthase (glutamine-hydrolysing)
MCGIAGLAGVPGHQVATPVLDRMAQALAHRGPDGIHSHLAGSIGLAHARLAIIDLTTGDQPLFGPDGLVLVANGEIYNDLDLRAALADRPFLTGSDCEAPLFLYGDHGPAFAEHLRGMYAIALADPINDRLTLCRDPFGIKPLYLCEGPFGVAFASEPRALIRAGLVLPLVDEAKMCEVLQLQFSTGAQTPIMGLRRLLPGETLVIEKGRIVSSQRSAALRVTGAPLRDEASALEALDAALTDSVRVHQRSDVPFGMFLSGGVDSACVLALMSRLNETPVRAFTAAFPGTGVHDERDQARAVAQACGAEHIEVEISEQDFWTYLPAIVASLDDPIADYAVVPTWLLAREARKSVKVILSGEGGDELFAGYGRYRAARRPWPFGKPMRRKGNFDGLGILRHTDGWRDGFAEAERAAKAEFSSPLKRLQAVDVADWLPNDLLTKLDRCLMAHGVEGRVPFLDPAVAAVAMRLDDSLAIQGKTGKWLLRRWLEKTCPVAQPFAAKKGFTVPVGAWIASRADDLAPLVAHSPGMDAIANVQAVEALFRSGRLASDKQRGFAAWTLLVYALWMRHHMMGQAMVGDVFEVLTASR